MCAICVMYDGDNSLIVVQLLWRYIYKSNSLNSVKVAKAGYADKNSLYEVDGISGATITSNRVTTFLLRDLKRYEKYFMRNLNE